MLTDRNYSSINSLKKTVSKTALFTTFCVAIFAASVKAEAGTDLPKIQGKVLLMNEETREEFGNISWEGVSKENNSLSLNPYTILEEDSVKNALFVRAQFLEKRFNFMNDKLEEYIVSSMTIIEESKDKNNGNLSKEEFQKLNNLRKKIDSLKERIIIACKDMVAAKLQYIELEIKEIGFIIKKVKGAMALDNTLKEEGATLLEELNKVMDEGKAKKQEINSVDCDVLEN